jgi:hypothetical protein
LRLCLSRGRLNALLRFRPPHHLRRTRLRTLNSRLHWSSSTRLRLRALDLRLTRRRLTYTRALRLLCSTPLVSLLLRLCLPFLLLQLLQFSLGVAISPCCLSRHLLLASRIHSGNICASRSLSRSI